MKLTNSDFINSLIESYQPGCNPFYKLALDNKSKVSSQIDILIYDTIMDKNNDTDNLIMRNANNTFEKHHDYIMAKKVECYYGKTSNSYQEFLRAFCKLIYRLFNDGDSVFYGPYSALNFYLNKTDGDRQFSFDDEFGYIRFHIYDDDFNDEYEDVFNNLIMYLCSSEDNHFWPDMVDCISNRFRNNNRNMISSIEKWIHTIVVLIDQLNDDIKGIKSEYFDDCSKYYKNALEYKDEKIYNYLSNEFGIYEWSAMDFNEERCETFEDDSELLDLDIDRYSNTYVMRFKPSMYSLSVDMKVKFEPEIQNEDLDNLIRFYEEFKKHNKIVSMTVLEFIKYGYDMCNHLTKQVKIIKVTKNEEDDDYTDKQVIFDDIFTNFTDKDLASRCTIISREGFPTYYNENNITKNVLRVTVKEQENET